MLNVHTLLSTSVRIQLEISLWPSKVQKDGRGGGEHTAGETFLYTENTHARTHIVVLHYAMHLPSYLRCIKKFNPTSLITTFHYLDYITWRRDRQTTCFDRGVFTPPHVHTSIQLTSHFITTE